MDDSRTPGAWMRRAARMPTDSVSSSTRIIEASPRRQIVEMCEVSLSTFKRYLKLRSQTGWLAPKPIPGRTPTKGAVLATDLPSQLAAHDDFTLEQHCPLWEASHGVLVSTESRSRAIARLGWTRNKNRWVPPSAPRPIARPGATSPPASQPSA